MCAHTRLHLRKSATYRRPSIDVHARVGGPRAPIATSRATAFGSQGSRRTLARPARLSSYSTQALSVVVGGSLLLSASLSLWRRWRAALTLFAATARQCLRARSLLAATNPRVAARRLEVRKLVHVLSPLLALSTHVRSLRSFPLSIAPILPEKLRLFFRKRGFFRTDAKEWRGVPR